MALLMARWVVHLETCARCGTALVAGEQVVGGEALVDDELAEGELAEAAGLVALQKGRVAGAEGSRLFDRKAVR